MNQSQVTVKYILIEANEILKQVFSGESEFTARELAEQIGEKVWKLSGILGIELD